MTVDLGDRTVSDAQMVVGSRGLHSQTARFSSLDRGKVVTIRGTGLLVTTIQAFQNPTHVTLAQGAQRGVTDSQADVWRTDSRPAFEQLLASIVTLDVAGVEIEFGPGVYDLRARPSRAWWRPSSCVG